MPGVHEGTGYTFEDHTPVTEGINDSVSKDVDVGVVWASFAHAALSSTPAQNYISTT